MMKNKNIDILAIIPARGKSKGVPKKNIKPLLGKPLIVYTIKSALKSEYLNRIIVSTDNKKVARISKYAGAEVIKRPKELAKDITPTYPVIEHATSYLYNSEKYRPDIIVLLQPTSPLRTAEDIDRAVDIFLKNKCESVISVCEPIFPLYRYFKIRKGCLIPIFGKKHFKKRKQEIEKHYVPNGAIFVSSIEALLANKSFYAKNILPYVMPVERSIDIDNEIDFKIAKALIK